MYNCEHYIALDWSMANMAIARTTKYKKEIEVTDVPACIRELKIYLKALKGRKVLTFEESTPSHWLYTELKNYADEIIVCDPRRNKLLSEGAKTDKIDAIKLVNLLKAGLLKPVFHNGNQLYELRKLTSGYEDLVKSGVRLKNQKKALLRSKGINTQTGEVEMFELEKVVLLSLERQIKLYEKEKANYEKLFNKIARNNKLVKNIKSIPGIGNINAVKLAAIVLDGRRFNKRNKFLSYCGLVAHDKLSGGRSYGKRHPQYNRIAKSIFKTAAIAVIKEGNGTWLNKYYKFLIQEKRYPEYQARHALARKIASIALGIMKCNRKFINRKDFIEKIAA